MAASDPLMQVSESQKSPHKYQKVNDAEKAYFENQTGIVEIEHKPAKLVGLTQEELEQYRNDPFWRPLRIFLIVLFWIAWIAMFIIAVIIVMMSPKCSAKAKLDWWQKMVSYQVWVPTFKDGQGNGQGDIIGVLQKTENLRKMGVQTLWINPVLKSDNFNYGVLDYLNVDEKLGILDDFKALIDDVHSKSMYLLMDLPLTTTSKKHRWFLASSDRNQTFNDYYLWRNSPRNARFWAESNGRYYLHYENRPQWPILNWNSPKVVAELTEAAKFWMDLGVDGFYLGYIDYLARNRDGIQSDWTKSVSKLADFRNAIQMYINENEMLKSKKILLFTSLLNGEIEQKPFLVKTAGLNLVINHKLSQLAANSDECPESTMAPCFYRTLKKLVQEQQNDPSIHPVWELGNRYSDRLATRSGNRQVAELMTFIQLLLPGSLNFYYGDEIGMENVPGAGKMANRGAMQWDGSQNAGFSISNSIQVPLVQTDDYQDVNYEKLYRTLPSSLKTFQQLVKYRQRDETLIMGDFKLGDLDQDSFVFSRLFSGNKTTGNIYLGLVNFGAKVKTFQLTDYAELYPVELANLVDSKVISFTSNVDNFVSRQNIDLDSNKITLGTNQGIVFRFSAK